MMVVMQMMLVELATLERTGKRTAAAGVGKLTVTQALAFPPFSLMQCACCSVAMGTHSRLYAPRYGRGCMGGTVAMGTH
jgi:hypothetical protein